MSEQNCGNCAHVFQVGERLQAPTKESETPAQQVKLGCRRFPPQTHFIMVLRGNALMGKPPAPVEEQRSAFPPVKPDWYCGEWKADIEVAA